MPKELVINTTPLISLLAGLGNLDVLPFMYSKVHVPFAVCQEVLAGGKNNFGVSTFIQNNWLVKYTQPITISLLLRNSLDLGEASVIELALQKNISLVCIDEMAGRRVARSVSEVLKSMRSQGIWLSDRLVELALKQSGEL